MTETPIQHIRPKTAKIIACETVAEELKPLIPEHLPYQFLKFGLHNTPEQLNTELQEAIDTTAEDVDTLLFGYGMCSKGLIGLHARQYRLVIPKADDCIALFLGSRREYLQQCRKEPGTFFLTKGWIECGDDPYTEYLKLCRKYGERKAFRIEKRVIANYTRLALINTGNYDVEKYRSYAQKQADFFGLKYEEIPGSKILINKLLTGDWDRDFVVVKPGGRVEQSMFMNE
jgi:hypothetical protein